MYLIVVKLNEKIFRLVLDKKIHGNTIKKMLLDKFWKEFEHYCRRKRNKYKIEILKRIPFKCDNCDVPVSVEEYSNNDTMLCQDCFGLSLLPIFDKELGYKVRNRVHRDHDVIYITSENF